MKTIKVFEAFAGYGSQAMALKRLERENASRCPHFEFVGISEIEPNAIKAYNAVHGDTKNYGDICKIDWNEVPDFDLLTYSFPCTDISQAGKQMGLEEGSGTRSSLLWECLKAIEIKKPKYLLMENVAALVSKKFIGDFNRWATQLSEMGYSNFHQLLNAKDYGVPQNRLRVFMVSILGDAKFTFPKAFPLEQHLIDKLEDEVDEKYYISDKMLAYFRRVDNDSRLGKSTTTT